MALLGNIIWFIIGGWWSFLLYGFLGAVCCITIIGIPIGKALFQYAKLMVFPFGKVIVKETDIVGAENVSMVRRVGGMIANILWLPVGIIIFIGNIGLIIVCAVTIIGIPLAVVLAKSCAFLIWPVGAKVITKEEEETLRMERSMMKVMGTAVAVSSMMPQNEQQTAIFKDEDSGDTVQSNQTLENLKSGSGRALENFKETGGRTLENLKAGSNKAAAAIAETGSAGMASIKEKQRVMTGQILARKKEITLDELLGQLEVKLYQNRVMAWIMPFLEYITVAVGIVFMILGGILTESPADTGGVAVAFYGMMTGLCMAAPLMLFAALLGMMKRNHVFVLIVLGTQFLANLVLCILPHAGGGGFILRMICYAGIVAWYVLTFVIETGEIRGKMQQRPATVRNRPGTAVPAAGRRFCEKCGAAYTGQIKFCPKCGAPIGMRT